jgi:hypothetical protein
MRSPNRWNGETMRGIRFGATAFAALAAVAASLPAAAPAQEAPRQVIELPLVAGWYDGRPVQYVTTDVSDAGAAAELGANYVPRLADALTPGALGKAGAVERIYRIANFRQGSVLPSIPEPAGAANRNRNYSPLWRVYVVQWSAAAAPHLLRSEEEILDAEEKGLLTIARSDIVVNCPVIFAAGSGLPNAAIKTVGTGAK